MYTAEDAVAPYPVAALRWPQCPLTYPGGSYYVDYDHLVTGEVTRIRENGATSGVGVIATYGYDYRGRRTSLTRGNGTSTAYAYDDASRLQSLTLDFPAASADHVVTFGYNAASQIVSRAGSNDAYSVTGLINSVTNAPANGLNQLTSSGAASLTYDPRGNLTSDGTVSYSYSSENLLTSLTSPSQSVTFSYDPLMRLAVQDSTSNALDASLGYDGANIVQESLSNGRTRRYVYGPGTDELLYSVLTNPSAATIYYWHHQDERGSVVRLSDELGDAYGVARYDEYGVNSGGSPGRLRYTGQYWLGEGQLHSFRARVYHPGLGRFLQTDPIGYGDGMNMYAYVRGDPVNRTDPSGMIATDDSENEEKEIVVEGVRIKSPHDDRQEPAGQGVGYLDAFFRYTGGGGSGGEWDVGGPAAGAEYQRRRNPPPPVRGPCIIDPEYPENGCRHIPRRPTPEERHRRTCEIIASGETPYPAEATIGLGQHVSRLGRFFGYAGLAVLYFDGIRYVHGRVEGC